MPDPPPDPAATPADRPAEHRRRPLLGGSLAVAAGILASRLAGLVRQSVFAFYFGNSSAADVFNAAFRIPNLLQNLFGEGALSASLIPVYARLRARGEHDEARRVAAVVASVLVLGTALLVLAGVLAAPWLLSLIAPGFEGERRVEALRLVRIFFPGAGLLVLSAWCLGILNSHRRFFLSYAAPVLWSLAIIAAMLAFGYRTRGYDLAALVAWGSVAGSALQLLVQLPTVLRLLPRLRPSLDLASTHVREVLRNFGPVALSRGVVQVSAYVDQIIASFLPTGAIAALGYAQVLYTLPVSLFGMAISAAELPAMSSAAGDPEQVKAQLRLRLHEGLSRIAFLVVPSAAGLLVLGDLLAILLFQHGRFGPADARYVWVVLAGSSIGLLAATMGRLYSSTFYALGDTRRPLRFAVARVALGSALGCFSALVLPGWLGLAPRLGTAFLTASSGLAGWVELLLLARSLGRRLGGTGIPLRQAARLWLLALGAALGSFYLKHAMAGALPARATALIALGLYGAAYLGLALLAREEAAREVARAIGRRLRRAGP